MDFQTLQLVLTTYRKVWRSYAIKGKNNMFTVYAWFVQGRNVTAVRLGLTLTLMVVSCAQQNSVE